MHVCVRGRGGTQRCEVAWRGAEARRNAEAQMGAEACRHGGARRGTEGHGGARGGGAEASTSPSPSRSMPNTENAPSVTIEMTFEPPAAYGPEGGEAEPPTWMRIRRTKEHLIDANPQTRTKNELSDGAPR